MVTTEEFRSLREQYGSLPRKKPVMNVSFAGMCIDVPDAASMLSQIREIFVEEQYQFLSTTESPVILDIGANIGIASLYFKKKWPNSRVYAWEADPIIGGYLRRNIERNDIEDVEVTNKAAWTEDTEIKFCSTGTDAGHIDNAEDNTVPAVMLSRAISNLEHIDLLKMDIEGSENWVFPSIESCLNKVDNIILEFHSMPAQAQKLASLLAILERTGFRYHIHQINKRNAPLINRVSKGFFDCQINIFAYRVNNG